MTISDRDQPAFICPHLTPSMDYCVWFTGHGRDLVWICDVCAKSYPQLPDALIEFPAELFSHDNHDGVWSGICGRPEINCRQTDLQFEHYEFSLPLRDGESLIDIQPMVQTEGKWLGLTSSGEIGEVDFHSHEFHRLLRVTDLGFEIGNETVLCLSSTPGFIAIYEASGRHAAIVDLRRGMVTSRVDRGEYRPENSHFPIAFFEHRNRSLLVAATDWNRVDIIEPESGAVLTNRGPTSHEPGGVRPENYLDYFHAQLLVSPNSVWIADNGWHWGPWGSVRSWNLIDWLEHNPWESEVGPTCDRLVGRAYYWDGPLCWVGDRTLAIWGWGEDDEWLIPAVHLFDVQTRQELGWFPGPEVRPPSAWPPKKQPKSLFFDEFLISAHDEFGSAVWNVESGERMLHDPSFAPVNYHLGSKEFLSMTVTGVCLSKLTHTDGIREIINSASE